MKQHVSKLANHMVINSIGKDAATYLQACVRIIRQ